MSRRRARRNPMMSDSGKYQDILAHLRALQWYYWTAHWQSAGPNFYGDHILLERLYTGKEGGPNIQEETDGLGERMVAYFGAESVEPTKISRMAEDLIGEYSVTQADLNGLLALEMSLQGAIHRAWKSNQEAGDHMSLGLDDYLMALANERETAVYLLRRRLGGREPLAGIAKKNPRRRRR